MNDPIQSNESINNETTTKSRKRNRKRNKRRKQRHTPQNKARRQERRNEKTIQEIQRNPSLLNTKYQNIELYQTETGIVQIRSTKHQNKSNHINSEPTVSYTSSYITKSPSSQQNKPNPSLSLNPIPKQFTA